MEEKTETKCEIYCGPKDIFPVRKKSSTDDNSAISFHHWHDQSEKLIQEYGHRCGIICGLACIHGVIDNTDEPIPKNLFHGNFYEIILYNLIRFVKVLSEELPKAHENYDYYQVSCKIESDCGQEKKRQKIQESSTDKASKKDRILDEAEKLFLSRDRTLNEKQIKEEIEENGCLLVIDEDYDDPSSFHTGSKRPNGDSQVMSDCVYTITIIESEHKPLLIIYHFYTKLQKEGFG